MGPLKAAQEFGAKYKGASTFEVTLYGALAGTGKGHMTDVAILDALNPIAPASIIWEPDIFLPFHPNGMKFRALDVDRHEIGSDIVYSIGGGDILHEGEERRPKEMVYGMSRISDILAWAEKSGRSFWEYVELNENSDVWDYLREVWQVMRDAVERGIEAEGVLPGDLV